MVRAVLALGCVLGCFASVPERASAADPPAPKLALAFKPSQKDVDYDVPDAKEVEKCIVQVERLGKASGWVVLSPTGQVLRRFVDTNGDNIVDQWRYYRLGLEVFRDIDSNFNNKIDQCRWLNSAGTRWGIDSNEDGRIDVWKSISAEEATREAVRALAARDEQALSILLITKEDIAALGIEAELAAKLQENVRDVPAKMRAAAASSKLVNDSMKWLRFDATHPGTIAADEGKAKQDLVLYENAMCIAESGGKTVLLQAGEIVRIGDVWKLTQIPVALEGESVQVMPGVLMQPAVVNPAASVAATTITPEIQGWLDKLKQLDESAPSGNASARAFGKYNDDRAKILEEIVKLTKTDEDRQQWTRQLVDGIAAAVQTGAYPDGVARLKAIEGTVEKSGSKPMMAYVAYRRMLAEYTLDFQAAPADKRQDVQDRWLKGLADFAKDHPTAEDTPEALLQLGIALEFGGKVSEARQWFETLAGKHRSTPQGAKADGALRRLDLKGKPFVLSGAGLKGGKIDTRDYRGRTLLVLYWASWCKPCTEDLPQLRALYQQYREQGFEILGVNLDTTPGEANAYVTEHRIPWPQIHEAGGLEGPPSTMYGIFSLPTMILVDATGLVHTRSVSTNDLKTLLPELVKPKK